MAVMMVMFGHFCIYASAYDYDSVTGTEATGADISGYESAIAVDVIDFGADPTGKGESGAAIQKALDYARKNSSSTVQVKVVIPSGTYGLEQTLYIYSNTWLCMDSDTVLRKDFSRGCMIRNAMEDSPGGYDAECNVIISGGCLDGDATGGTPFCHLRMAHMKNVWIKDVEFVNNVNCHHAEFGGVQNLTIEGCTFHGYYGTKYKEAIQLDAMNNTDVFADFAPFDDTCCDNVVIRNNKFYDLMRGIGSHSATIGVYYTNVLVSGNTFEDIDDVAIIMQNYRNCIIEDNTMNNVGGGIEFKNMTYNEFSGYNAPVNGYDSVDINDFCNTVIRRNTINTSVTDDCEKAMAIQVYGKSVKSGLFPEHNYKVEGMVISDNIINTSGIAVQLIDTEGVKVSSNTITYNDGGDHFEYSLTESRDSTDVLIQSNSITGGTDSGIYINDGSSNTVSENTCISNGVSGIYVSNSAKDTVVTNNSIEKSGGNGLTVNKSGEAELTGNTMKSCSGSGLMVNDGSVTVSENSFIQNSGSGIEVKNAKVQMITSNTFNGNSGYAVLADDKGEAVVGGNIYEDASNGKYGTNGGSISTPGVESFTADGVYNDHVQLSWEAAGEAESYSVKRRVKDTDEEFTEIAKVSVGSFADERLAPKMKYEYRVDSILSVNGEDKAVSSSDLLTVKTKSSISDCTSDLEEVYRYSGHKVEPDIHLYLGDTELVPDIDYKLTYKNNLAIGKATISVTGCGQYFGFKDLEFEISASKGKLADSSDRIMTGIVGEGKSDKCMVTAVTGSGFDGKAQSPLMKTNEQPYLIGTINDTKQSTGVEIFARRQGDMSGLWL